MLLAVDIGNTSINLGFFTENGLVSLKIPTHPLLPASEYASVIRNSRPGKGSVKSGFPCIISSVVSSHTAVLSEAIETLGGGIMPVSYLMNTGFRFAVKNPAELGRDRIADMAGACSKYGMPVVVADLGTATTISAVDREANFIGGAIMPGPGLMNEALEMRTSGLRRAPLNPPSSAAGKDTAACMDSGIILGTAGAVERITAEIDEESGCVFNLILTGGYAALIDPFIKRPHVTDLTLTLEGLKTLYEKNRHS